MLVAFRGYLCKLFLLGAVWHTSTDKYFTFFDHFCGFGLILQLPARAEVMVELLLHHEAYNLVTQSLGKYNFDQQHSAGSSQQDRSDSIIKSHKLQDMCVSSHADRKMCYCTPKTF